MFLTSWTIKIVLGRCIERKQKVTDAHVGIPLGCGNNSRRYPDSRSDGMNLLSGTGNLIVHKKSFVPDSFFLVLALHKCLELRPEHYWLVLQE